MRIERKRQLHRKTVPLLVMVTPVSLWLLLLIAVPLIYILVISFCSTDANHNIVFAFTLQNYIKMADPSILTIYANSIAVAFFATVVCILVGYPFAYIMAFQKSFQKSVMMVFLLLPFWTNSIIRLYGWRTLLGTNGYFNQLLQAVGIISDPLPMLYTRGAVVLGMVYMLMPFMVLPIHTVLDKLDRTLLEAASDLGAKPVARFWNITLPLTMPGIFAGFIMVFIPSLAYFFVSNILGGGKNQLIGNVIERQFKEAFNWPFGSALSIVLIVITLLLVRIYTRLGGNVEELGAMS
jgi:spermidine/putrescine transport system permease protein